MANHAPTLATAPLPRRVRRVLEQLLALTATEMGGYLNRMLDEFEQQLFLHADHARNPALQSGYLDTLATLRMNRPRLLPAFLREIEAGLAGIRAHVRELDEDGKARAIPFRKLSLVDDQELDEETVLRDMAQRQEARASLPLHLLGQRFGVLAGSAAHDAERLPLGPRAIARALREASKVLQVNAEARLLLFRTFDRMVMGNCEQFAKLVNGRLVGEGILPSLSYVPLRVRPPGTPAQAPDRDAQAGGKDPPMLGWNPQGAAPPAASALDDATLFQMLRELLAERRLAQGAPAAAPVREAALAMHGGPDAAVADPVSVRLPATAAAGVDIARDATELVALLCRQVEAQVRPESTASTLLARLQEPLQLLARQDPGVLTQPRHPARQLLNAVAECGARWAPEGEVDAQLPEHLQRAVEEVAAAPGDVGAFDAANRKLQHYLQQLARRAEVAERRQVEAARGKEKLELAKRRAAETLEAEVRNQPLSRFVLALLSQAWADVLTLTLLRHGDDADEWRQRLAVTREVVEIASGQRAHAFNPALTSSVREALVQVGYHAEDAQAIARRLTSGLGDDEDDPASRTELAMRLKSRARLGELSAPVRNVDVTYGPAEQAAFAHLRSLPLGTWFEFRQDGGAVRRRLSWYSTVTDSALFVNLRGQRAEERSLHEVVGLLASGELRAVPPGEGALVDQAWRNAIEALRGEAAGITA